MHLYFDHLFLRLPSLCQSIRLLCTRFSKHFSAVHSVVIVGTGDSCLFKLLLKFRNVLKPGFVHFFRNNFQDFSRIFQRLGLCSIPRAEAPLVVVKLSKKTSPRKHSRSARVTSSEKLGTMSKN